MKGLGMISVDAKRVFTVMAAALAILACAQVCRAVELQPSFFESDLQRLKYHYATAVLTGSGAEVALVEAGDADNLDDASVKRKSPFKAFLLSAAVPGLGQYYYGSRVKPFIFLGAEITAWGLYFKWHGDGQDKEDLFEAFNREHWSETSYEQYLFYAYGEWDDELVNATEVSHHLPDTRTQQYYEMTGKYDQFAWGWDDATRDGNTLDDYAPPNNTNLAITSEAKAPVSQNRLHYEDMRHDANQAFDRAQKMVIASIVNRLVSAFEAYFVTKSQGKSSGSSRASSPSLGGFKVSASLKSYHSRRDTPYLKVTYRF